MQYAPDKTLQCVLGFNEGTVRNHQRIYMEVALEVPEAVASVLGYDRQTLPKRALEALLVDECARGRLSRGKVAELLGLSFHEAEDLFRFHRVPYPVKTSADDRLDNA